MARPTKTDVTTKFHALTTYVSEDQLKTVIQAKSSQIEHARYIFHYKEDKEPHTHIVIVTSKPRKLSEIRAWFKDLPDTKGEKANTLSEELYSTQDMEEYMLHEDDDSKADESKHQYLAEDIKVLQGDTDEYLSLETRLQETRRLAEESEERKLKQREASADDVEGQLDDIIKGTPLREMARKYGRDYIKNRRAYNEYAAMVVCEETGVLPLHLLADPIVEKMNEQRRQAANDGYEEALRVSNALWNMAANDCGIPLDKINQITNYMSKMLRKD